MINKKILLSIILFLTLFSFLSSQSITWTKVYGGSYDEYPFSIKQTSDGGYIVIGSTESFGSDYYNTWLLKLDQYGDTLWSKVFDSIVGTDIEVDYDSGYIFVSSIKTSSPYVRDLIIVKTDIYGDSLWSRRYNIQNYGSCYDYPSDIDKTSDSCYVIVGDAEFGNQQGFIFKIDHNGDSIWATVFLDEMHYTSVCETSDKGFFTTAQTHPWKEISLVKFDSLGNWIYYKMIIDTLNTNVKDIEILEDDNYIMLSTNYLVKIDSSADTLWSGNLVGLDVAPTEDSGCVITGGNGDLYLIKFNKNGDSLWSAEYGGSGGDYGRSIEQTSDGGYIIAGVTNSYGAGEDDFYIIKTDSLGYALGIEEQVKNNNSEYFNISHISKQNGNIEFNFSLPKSDYIKLEIFDLSGRLILTPISDHFSEGEHEINITLPNNGVYIYRFSSSLSEQSGKLLVF